ncbi:MAG: HK97 gp10 family phage protein [Proteobacteria bacterium]|nr:HK97 gp10 family phage protein [Pseudomonadota bacterium]
MASSGIRRLTERLNAIPVAVKEAVRPSLEQSGGELVGAMRSLAPVSADGSHGKPPGTLKDSILMTPPGATTPAYSQPGGQHVVPENAVAVSAGNSECRYAHFPEYGTKKMTAEPYFWPSYRLLKKRIKARTKRAISKAVREGWVK